MNNGLQVRRKNPSWDEKIKRNLQRFDKRAVAIGYPEGTSVTAPHYETGESILDRAVWNNFGIGVPRRPFMDEAADPVLEKGGAMLRTLAKRVGTQDIDADRVLDAAGFAGEAVVKEVITTGNWIPNSPVTIAKKGSDRPLIDSADMRNNATHIVRKLKR